MEKNVSKFFEKFVKESPMFHYLHDSDAQKLSEYLEFKHIKRGEVLFNEGDPGNYVAFILKGSVEISTKNSGGGDYSLAQLGWGTSVGEMALIDELPRSATASVVDDSDFFILSRENLTGIIQKHPGLGIRLLLGLAWTMSLRLRYNSRRLIDHVQL